jgi:hypothetical protein
MGLRLSCATLLVEGGVLCVRLRDRHPARSNLIILNHGYSQAKRRPSVDATGYISDQLPSLTGSRPTAVTDLAGGLSAKQDGY